MRRFLMFLAGLGAGVAAGGVLAMLFTPASGDRLRQEAQASYDQLLAEARQAATARREELALELKDLTGSGQEA